MPPQLEKTRPYFNYCTYPKRTSNISVLGHMVAGCNNYAIRMRNALGCGAKGTSSQHKNPSRVSRDLEFKEKANGAPSHKNLAK